MRSVFSSMLGMTLLLAITSGLAHAQESGHQVINGTRVFTQIDHANQRATFSNECGRQTISRSALQAGAIPDQIIPCPRPTTRSAGSCEARFIGQWRWVSSNGISTVHDFQRGGRAVCSGNLFCTGSATWRCQGNQLTYNNGMSDTVLTLGPDGNTLTGVGGSPANVQTVTRVGSAPQQAAATSPPRPSSADATPRSSDTQCTARVRHVVRATYNLQNSCARMTILAVVDSIEIVNRRCVRTVETIFAGDQTHVMYSHFATAPKIHYTCNSTTSAGRNSPTCNRRALLNRFGSTC